MPRIGIWANTKRVKGRGVRQWLKRAGLNHHFTWVITSVDAGSRKPSKEFFDYALRTCGTEKQNILFVGNQLNSDIKGASQYGIKTSGYRGSRYRSKDETMTTREVRPTYTIKGLRDLPELLDKIARGK